MTHGIVTQGRIPREFFLRRVHSLMGLFVLIFLIEHLFTNSQILLFFMDEKFWFINSVNALNDLPYLHLLEIVFIGIPIFYHAVLGAYYLYLNKSNWLYSDGSRPCIRKGRNFFYFLHRWSAVILIVGVIFHVVQMRFLDRPFQVNQRYFVPLSFDVDLQKITHRLHVKLYCPESLDGLYEKQVEVQQELLLLQRKLLERVNDVRERLGKIRCDGKIESIFDQMQKAKDRHECLTKLRNVQLQSHQILAEGNFGALEVLVIRQVFQNIWICFFYTIFVLAAVLHGFHGLWTFLLTWGFLLATHRSQSRIIRICFGAMAFFCCLGLMAIWGSYFVKG